jgi:hypothetical protein
MNADHYAVVVGLTSYPRLGEPPPSDLSGPANDADAIIAWLTGPAEGGLPAENVLSITSPVPPAAAGAPGRDEIQSLFERLVEMAEARRGSGGAQLGKRLYVYASGHGFSPTLNQGCLHAGNATSDSVGFNVFFTAWLELFQEAGYFRETVLWMDCCMNRESKNAPSLPTKQVKISPDPAGPSFVAFAARRPLRAVERADSKGAVHGVFTTILLEGLRGAATNRYGMVTGRSLADWLRNAQRSRIDGPDLDDPRVSKEPEILREDPHVIFARGLPLRTYPVTLKFSRAAGMEARLWSSRPPRSENLAIPASGKVRLSLQPGMYVVDLPARQLRQGFQVTSPLDVAVTASGPAVNPTDEMVSFTVSPPDPGAEIFIVDEAFTLVDRGVDHLSVTLPLGIYKVRVRSGRRMSEEIHMLDRVPTAPAAALAPFASAAPLQDTAFVHEYHERALEVAAGRLDAKLGSGGELLIMTRQWRSDDSIASAFEPWKGMRIVSGMGRTIANLEEVGMRQEGRDPVSTLSLGLDPGTYFLRMKGEGGREEEQSIVVSPDWRTDVHVLSAPYTDAMPDQVTLRLSLLMHRCGGPATHPSDLAIDQARVALADERLVLGGDLTNLLVTKFDNPIAGIIGGHLLLVQQSRIGAERPGLLNEVVTNLRGLVGDNHPDVEALSLRCTDRTLRNRSPFTVPPMFQASWQLIVEASQRRGELLPRALWQRVHALVSLAPFMRWGVDRGSKARSRRAILSGLIPPELAEQPRAEATSRHGVRRAIAPAAASEPAPARRSRPAADVAHLLEESRSLPARVRAIRARAKALGLPPSAFETF